jgi:catechol 2,3-dioxygenase-like lactoylglutathione lyase family enzyme
MAIRRLQHASVLRPAGEAARAQAVHFYAGILGCEEVPKPNTFTHIDTTWFRLGDDEIHILAAEQDAPIVRHGAHVALVCDDLQAMRDRLEGAGISCWDATPIPGRPRFMTRDPFGNQIEITMLERDQVPQ